MNLFSYLDNQSSKNQLLGDLATKHNANNLQDMGQVSLGITQGNFDEMLSEMEKGNLNVKLETMGNYVSFNMQKMGKELVDLAASYGVARPVEISMEEDKLTVLDDSPEGKKLQEYLDKDERLNSLVKQTSKLSQFYEWGKVREQATSYQNSEVNDEDLLSFLQEGRESIVHQNSLFISSTTTQFYSQQRAGALIEKYDEQFGFNTQNRDSQETPAQNQAAQQDSTQINS